MNYCIGLVWVSIGGLMVYMNDYNIDTMGWLFIVGSIFWFTRK